MAEPRYNPTNPGDAAAKLGPERARQGQNIHGMIWVLGIGILLVVIAFGVMLALGSTTTPADNTAVEPDVAVAPATPPGTTPTP